MTIINFVQNNHRSFTTHSTAALESNLRFSILSGWLSHLTYLHQEAGKELALLQAGPAPAEAEKSLAKLSSLREETTLGLERLTELIKKEPADSTVQQFNPTRYPRLGLAFTAILL